MAQATYKCGHAIPLSKVARERPKQTALLISFARPTPLLHKQKTDPPLRIRSVRGKCPRKWPQLDAFRLELVARWLLPRPGQDRGRRVLAHEMVGVTGVALVLHNVAALPVRRESGRQTVGVHVNSLRCCNKSEAQRALQHPGRDCQWHHWHKTAWHHRD